MMVSLTRAYYPRETGDTNRRITSSMKYMSSTSTDWYSPLRNAHPKVMHPRYLHTPSISIQTLRKLRNLVTASRRQLTGSHQWDRILSSLYIASRQANHVLRTLQTTMLTCKRRRLCGSTMEAQINFWVPCSSLAGVNFKGLSTPSNLSGAIPYAALLSWRSQINMPPCSSPIPVSSRVQ